MKIKSKCPHCKGKKSFKTRRQHPRGAGHTVPCSKCGGLGHVWVEGGEDGE